MRDENFSDVGFRFAVLRVHGVDVVSLMAFFVPGSPCEVGGVKEPSGYFHLPFVAERLVFGVGDCIIPQAASRHLICCWEMMHWQARAEIFGVGGGLVSWCVCQYNMLSARGCAMSVGVLMDWSMVTKAACWDWKCAVRAWQLRMCVFVSSSGQKGRVASSWSNNFNLVAVGSQRMYIFFGKIGFIVKSRLLPWLRGGRSILRLARWGTKGTVSRCVWRGMACWSRGGGEEMADVL